MAIAGPNGPVNTRPALFRAVGRAAGAQRFRAFTATRLCAYGIAIACVYATVLAVLYRNGSWIVDRGGVPIYTDFACGWAAAVEAVHGAVAALYRPADFARVQAALLGPHDYFYPHWPYPPTFLLVMAPFAALPYGAAFLVWDMLSLIGMAGVVVLIVRRPAALALLLASPFTFWNFLAAQNGFLTAALLGASLVALERRPVLAGALIGCLTYKPQFTILFPIALIASRRWRALAAAGLTVGLLVLASCAMFGAASWEALPHQLAAQANEVLGAGGGPAAWGYLQSPYGVVRALQGGPLIAWLVQAAASTVLAATIWPVWRRPLAYPLKAATLSLAALVATPYAFAYDMAALAIPAAFVARHQIESGCWLRGEASIAAGVFLSSLAALVIFWDRPGSTTFGGISLGPIVALILLALTARRTLAELNRTFLA